MDFHDPSINDEINAILSNREIWSVEHSFKIAVRTVLTKLYKRGYSKEELFNVYKDVSDRRLKMLLEYHQELVKGLHVEGDTDEEAKNRKWVILT